MFSPFRSVRGHDPVVKMRSFHLDGFWKGFIFGYFSGIFSRYSRVATRRRRDRFHRLWRDIYRDNVSRRGRDRRSRSERTPAPGHASGPSPSGAAPVRHLRTRQARDSGSLRAFDIPTRAPNALDVPHVSRGRESNASTALPLVRDAPAPRTSSWRTSPTG